MIHADGDADLETAGWQDIIIVDEGTDLLVLLCHHASLEEHDICLRSEKRQNTKDSTKVWDIRGLKKDPGNEICKHILFACDNSLIPMHISDIRHWYFFYECSTKTHIRQAGEASLVTL